MDIYRRRLKLLLIYQREDPDINHSIKWVQARRRPNWNEFTGVNPSSCRLWSRFQSEPWKMVLSFVRTNSKMEKQAAFNFVQYISENGQGCVGASEWCTNRSHCKLGLKRNKMHQTRDATSGVSEYMYLRCVVSEYPQDHVEPTVWTWSDHFRKLCVKIHSLHYWVIILANGQRRKHFPTMVLKLLPRRLLIRGLQGMWSCNTAFREFELNSGLSNLRLTCWV